LWTVQPAVCGFYLISASAASENPLKEMAPSVAQIDTEYCSTKNNAEKSGKLNLLNGDAQNVNGTDDERVSSHAQVPKMLTVLMMRESLLMHKYPWGHMVAGRR